MCMYSYWGCLISVYSLTRILTSLAPKKTKTLLLNFKMHSTCYRYLDLIERAIASGDCLLLENIGESIDPVLNPLLGRLTIKKGKYLKIGDKEIEYHPNFRLILQVSYI